jgi:hypothetical protein
LGLASSPPDLCQDPLQDVEGAGQQEKKPIGDVAHKHGEPDAASQAEKPPQARCLLVKEWNRAGF